MAIKHSIKSVASRFAFESLEFYWCFFAQILRLDIKGKGAASLFIFSKSLHADQSLGRLKTSDFLGLPIDCSRL